MDNVLQDGDHDKEVSIDALVEGYIKARDKKAELKKAYEEKVAKLDEWMANTEAAFLAYFTRQGVESTRTPNGTVYRSTRTSAKVADWERTLNYIRENEAWQLLEARVSKSAIEEMIEAEGKSPPGVELVRQHTVGVRRA